MNDILAGLFRGLFGFLAWFTIFVVAFLGVARAVTGPQDMQMLTLMGTGVAVVVVIMVFGLTAVMVQNNDLLREIRDRLGSDDRTASQDRTGGGAGGQRREPAMFPASRAQQQDRPSDGLVKVYKGREIRRVSGIIKVGDVGFAGVMQAEQYIDKG